MQLINMDVKHYGTHELSRLGPLSPGLNAICGPKGSGKTTLLSWLRHLTADESARPSLAPIPAGQGSKFPVAGSLDFENRGRHFRIRSDHDGHRESTSLNPLQQNDPFRFLPGGYSFQNNLSPQQRDAFISLADAGGAMDTEASLEALAKRLRLDESVAIESDSERKRLIESIEALEARRKSASLHVEDCRQKLRDAELHRYGLVDRRIEPRGRVLEDIQRDLDVLLSELRDWDDRNRLRSELDEIHRRLTSVPDSTGVSRFREAVNRHVAGLMGGRDRHVERGYPDTTQRRYDLVDGLVYDSEARRDHEPPSAIVRMAMRLAIAQCMSARGEPVALVFDESLDALPPDSQQLALSHLAKVASSDQQIVVLTGDERVAELVRGHRGWVGYLSAEPAPRMATDINRHLSALANSYEADKWHQADGIRREPVRRIPMVGEFYLSENSPIEESPSMDAACAARCRRVGIEQVGDLLRVDPYWLAEQVRREGVRGSTIAGWQAEAGLLCSVRQLRPFDARLLVGMGIRTPQRLAEMHPSQLLDRMERFLATNHGRRILRSGSSYELSRITTWIASAKGGPGRQGRAGFAGDSYEAQDGYSVQPRSHSGYRSERSEWLEPDGNLTRSNRGTNSNSASPAIRSRPRADSRERDYPVISRTDEPRERCEPERAANERRERRHSDRSVLESKRSAHEKERRDSWRLAKAEREGGNSNPRKFFLELASPVVDAPSIGPRMASRLERIGIRDVDQLLAADAAALADKLNVRRVEAATIRTWQEQARLICRVPNLRVHDAQLLVACDLTSPEELAAMNPKTVLAQVLRVANSNRGRRILRGGKEPGLEEVSNWINWANQCRSLSAA